MQTEEQDKRAKGGSSKREVSKPYVLCIFANICFAGFPVVIKVSLDKGMSCYVLVVYGHAFGTLATALLALLFESLHKNMAPSSNMNSILWRLINHNLSRDRKNESKISVPIIRNVFFLGLLGGVLGRTLNYMGLEYTSPAIASAMGNLIPCFTFIIAVLCRMEKFDITKLGTQAKIGGTLIAFAGAALMTLYKGIAVISMHTQASHQSATSKSSVDRDWIKGSLILLVSYFSSSAFYILQTTTIEMYPAPITLTSITCLSGTLLTAIMAAILDHEASSWKLSWDSTLLAPLYSGVLIFGITIYVQTLVVKTRGPVFMTAFRPLSTIVAAIMGLFVLREAIYLGSILGASLIIVGLSATLWGKNKEKEKNPLEDATSQEICEIQLEN
ncbi:unnamed protein product [Prunus armeniaca]|uniref:WAT1-related protein n=1 Tax=Prunus armeniaca TaxID=36596 RepID=A0A6J5UFQ6_PRUAR|nr:unnamed protein product [Prunus armeniaca]